MHHTMYQNLDNATRVLMDVFEMQKNENIFKPTALINC